MWMKQMTREDYKAFLVAHADLIMDELLDAYSYTLDSIVMDELQEELEEYAEEIRGYYGEAC